MSIGGSSVETVAGFAMTVTAGEPVEGTDERWVQRSEALAEWLLTEWRRKRGETAPPSEDHQEFEATEPRDTERGTR